MDVTEIKRKINSANGRIAVYSTRWHADPAPLAQAYSDLSELVIVRTIMEREHRLTAEARTRLAALMLDSARLDLKTVAGQVRSATTRIGQAVRWSQSEKLAPAYSDLSEAKIMKSIAERGERLNDDARARLATLISGGAR